MGSGANQKSEIELRRDARVAELALQVRPMKAAIEAAAKELGTSIPNRKTVKQRHARVPSLPTRKSARVRNKDLEASSEDVDIEDDMSASEDSFNPEEENEDNEFKEDEGLICGEASGSKNKRMRDGVSSPSLNVGFKRPQMHASPGGQWQWQWIPPQSMPPPPTEPPQWAMVDSHISGHVQSQEVMCKSDSVERELRRKRQNEFEKIAELRSNSGKKLNELHVHSNGEIDASSLGKTAWDRSMRAFAPLILDMSIIDWDKHKSQTLKKLKETMDLEFEYVGGSLSNQGFRFAVQRFLRGERCRLKKLSNPQDDDDCPVNIDPQQWKRLKAYWNRGDQVKKSEKMSDARKQVQNVSKRGRRGKAGEEVNVAKELDRSPGLSELGEALQASGSSTVSSGLHAKIVALENRQEEFEKFRVQVLASTDRNTKAVEALQTTLMKFLEKGSILQKENEVLITTTTSPSPTIDLGGPSTIVEPALDLGGPSTVVEPTIDLGGPSTVLEPAIDLGGPSIDLGGPSTVIEPMECINFIINPYEFDNHQSLEPASEQPSLEKNDNDGMEEQPIQGQKKNSSGHLDGSHEPLMKGSEVEDKDGADLVVLDNLTVIGQVPKNPSKDKTFSMQLRNAKDREKPAAKKEILKMKVQSTQGQRMECSIRNQKMGSPKKPKYTIGQQVSLVNPSAPKQVVASGIVIAIGGGPGPQLYHGQPIPKGWYRLDIKHAPGGFVDLMHPNPNGDELKLKDVVGANTIWDGQYIVMIPRITNPNASNLKDKIGGK